MSDEKKIVECGADGCETLKLANQEFRKDLASFTGLLEKSIDSLGKAVDRIDRTSSEVEKTLIIQTERLKTGSDKFRDILDDQDELKATAADLTTRVTVLESKVPTKSMSAMAGGGGAGITVILWELAKNWLFK